MVRMGQVQDRVAQQNQQLFVLAVERTGKRIILGFADNSFPCPLPKLRLRRPKLLAIATNNERGLLLFLFLLCFTGAHEFNRYTSVPACISFVIKQRMATRGTR
jgi:hypothetical protein